MKYLPIAAALLLLACNEPEQPKVASKIADKKARGTEVRNPKVVVGIEGFYTGAFKGTGDNDYWRNARITICIDSVRGETVWGWSMVSGNGRPFTGRVTHTDGAWSFTGTEPGDDPHDGLFTGTFADSTLTGSWVANDKASKIPKRTFELERRVFRYDSSLMLDGATAEDFNEATWDDKKEKGEMLGDAVFTLNASAKELKPSDLENLYKADLEVLRNTVYARHGYSFRNARIRAAFDHSVSWYMPVSTDVTAQLTPLELKNIALIKRYEGHATKYYDSFGR